MRLLCPNCAKELQVPDQYAGQMMKCPLCTGTFTVPALPQMPGAASMPAPPPMAPPPPPPMMAPPPSAAAPPSFAPSEAGQPSSLTLSPTLIRWLMPISLLAIFVLMFFSWVGMYPGEVGAVTQTGWGTAFGGASVDPVWDQYATRDTTKPWAKYYGDAGEKLKAGPSNGLLLLYALLIVLALILALAAVAISAKILPIQPPAALAPFWGMRSLFIAALALAALVVLFLQTLGGFSLKQVARDEAKRMLQEQRGNPSSPDLIKRWDIEEGILVGGYHVQTTRWLTLVMIFNVLAVLGGILDYWVERKGPQGMPRLELRH